MIEWAILIYVSVIIQQRVLINCIHISKRDQSERKRNKQRERAREQRENSRGSIAMQNEVKIRIDLL